MQDERQEGLRQPPRKRRTARHGRRRFVLSSFLIAMCILAMLFVRPGAGWGSILGKEVKEGVEVAGKVEGKTAEGIADAASHSHVSSTELVHTTPTKNVKLVEPSESAATKELPVYKDNPDLTPEQNRIRQETWEQEAAKQEYHDAMAEKAAELERNKPWSKKVFSALGGMVGPFAHVAMFTIMM